MCIISFHLNDHPTYKLILIANRDEAYARPTAPQHFWEETPSLLAGRDLKAKGTWLGITKQGRIAALTNFRDPNQTEIKEQSRGDIVRDYLTGSQSARHFLQDLQTKRHHYNGFNLLVGTVDELFFYSKQENKMAPLTAGTYSVSNASLNTSWPKVTKAKDQLQSYVSNNENIDMETLFAQLAQSDQAFDIDLPNTGVGIALERQLSPIFIQTEHYGTRSSTVLLVTHDNKVKMTERTFLKGAFESETSHRFPIE